MNVCSLGLSTLCLSILGSSGSSQQELSKWVSPDQFPGDDALFLCPVAVDQEHFLVVCMDFFERGKVCVHDTATGDELFELTVPGALAEGLFSDEGFGSGLALLDGRAIVGAPNADGPASDTGAAYVFDLTNGSLLRTLTVPGAAVSDALGTDVALSANYLVAGAPGVDVGFSDQGAAYVFDAVSGNLLHTLLSPAPIFDDHFGASVAVAGGRVLVGAPEGYLTDEGAAFLFDAASGNLLFELTDPTVKSDDQFGRSVTLDSTYAIVGAPRADTSQSNSFGRAHVFDVNTGQLIVSVEPDAPGVNWFAYDLALDGSSLAIGSFSAGAFVYDLINGQLVRY